MNLKISAFVMLLLFSGITFSQTDIDATTLMKIGDNMPSFTTASLSGVPFSSDALKGKVVLINFWATWCPPCKLELPVLQKNIYDKINDANFQVLCISRGEKEDVVKKFIEKFNYTFPVYLDPDKKTYKLFATTFIPRNFVIGKDGKIKWAGTGFIQKEFDEMITLIKEELKR